MMRTMMEKIQYGENASEAFRYREDYLNGIEKIICARQRAAEKERREFAREIFREPEKYRQELRNMLGWPLAEVGEMSPGEAHPAEEGAGTKHNIPAVQLVKLSEEADCSIYRLTLEVLEGLNLTGLLFKKGQEKRPLVIAQHGKLGTPELASGFYGNTFNYNNVIARILQYNVNVFAPQLLLWDSGAYGAEFDRENIDARLKSTGSSIAALEIYGLTRVLDYFEARSYVGNFGMIGLSYGGFYTLYTAAIDTRIKSAISCSFFNQRNRYAWSDWTWLNSAKKFHDAEVACLAAPRRLCIEVGSRDEAFDIEGASNEFQRLKDLCGDAVTDWLQFIEFDGRHEFCKDDGPIQRLVEDLK